MSQEFGKIHESLILCEWCGNQLQTIQGHRIFNPGTEQKSVSYVGYCATCGDTTWSQEITPLQAQRYRKEHT